MYMKTIGGGLYYDMSAFKWTKYPNLYQNLYLESNKFHFRGPNATHTFHFHVTPMDFDQAYAYCLHTHMHLIRMDSKEILDAITDWTHR